MRDCCELHPVLTYVYMYCTDSSFVPPLVYALMGSSKDLAVGTVAVASLLISSMLSREVSPTENPALYLHLALTATFFAGVFQASLGLLRYTPHAC
jgi:sulfate transporter 3